MSRHTQDTATAYQTYQYGTFTLYGITFQLILVRWYIELSQSYNPCSAVTKQVWAVSLSLATTQEIDVSFSSSAYLDVSVQRVCPPLGVTGLLPAGLPHSEISGLTRFCQSPELIAA